MNSYVLKMNSTYLSLQNTRSSVYLIIKNTYYPRKYLTKHLCLTLILIGYFPIFYVFSIYYMTENVYQNRIKMILHVITRKGMCTYLYQGVTRQDKSI